MTYTVYEIFNGSTPVTNLMTSPLDDLDTAMRLAQEISEGQSDATITVRARDRSPDGSKATGAFTGEWRPPDAVATFVGGVEVAAADV